MMRYLLLISLASSLVALIKAACSGCAVNATNCPPGFVYSGPPLPTGGCEWGDVIGSACCHYVACEPKISRGTCTSDNLCPALPGYACDSVRRWCCPEVDYGNNKSPSNVIGPAIGGLCPLKYVLVMNGVPEGECVALKSVPGVCSESAQRGSCPNGKGCGAGYECNTIAQVCCPFTTPVVVENVNCVKWNQDPNNVFCASATDEQKREFCPATCVEDIAPTDSCIEYRYSDNDPYTKDPMITRYSLILKPEYSGSGYNFENNGRTFNKLLYVFVKEGFRLDLHATGDSYMNHIPPVASYSGKNGSRWYKITDPKEQGTLEMQCERY